MFCFLLCFHPYAANNVEAKDIEVKASVASKVSHDIKNENELHNFLINSHVSSKNVDTLVKKAKFATRCGIIIHDCRFTSCTTEQIRADVARCGDDFEAFQKVFDEDFCRLAYRNADIISIQKNGAGFTVTVTHIEGGAYYYYGDQYDFILALYYVTRDKLVENQKWYDDNNIQQYFNDIEAKFRPLLNQYY